MRLFVTLLGALLAIPTLASARCKVNDCPGHDVFKYVISEHFVVAFCADIHCEEDLRSTRPYAGAISAFAESAYINLTARSPRGLGWRVPPHDDLLKTGERNQDNPPVAPVNLRKIDIIITSYDEILAGGASERTGTAPDGRTYGRIYVYAHLPANVVPYAVTHEVCHIVQFGYTSFDRRSSWLEEATAVWFEQKMLGRHDGFTGLEPIGKGRLFVEPEISIIDPANHYASWLFFEFLTQRTNPAIVETTWEQFSDLSGGPARDETSAVDRALRSDARTLDQTSLDFSVAMLAPSTWLSDYPREETTIREHTPGPDGIGGTYLPYLGRRYISIQANPTTTSAALSIILDSGRRYSAACEYFAIPRPIVESIAVGATGIARCSIAQIGIPVGGGQSLPLKALVIVTSLSRIGTGIKYCWNTGGEGDCMRSEFAQTMGSLTSE